MQFIWAEGAGDSSLELEAERFHYMVKVRRHRVNEVVHLRNPHHRSMLHRYRIEAIGRRSATLRLEASEEEVVGAASPLHIGWCVIDMKSVEKALPMLNELGVERISFIYCERSQRTIKPDIERFERICDASSMQCGRSALMQFETFESLAAFMQAYPQSGIIDFGAQPLFLASPKPQSVVIGCEGGFTDNERARFESAARFGLQTALILRSETAAVTVAAQLLT